MISTRHVWIDTDMGFDDLAAIVTVAARPDFAIGGVSLVAGNAALSAVTENAVRAAECFRWTMPLHAGRARPLIGPPIDAAYVHGDSGMISAGRVLPPAQVHRAVPDDAVEAMAAWLAGIESRRDILALGPLTNIAELLLAHPQAARQIDRLVWMGGSLGPGNHTSAAEFNAAADPEAAEIVLRAGLNLQMIDLEICRKVRIGLGDVAVLRRIGGERALLLADLMEGYVRIASPDGSAPMSLYDPVAAVALLEPDCFSFDAAFIQVELAGTLTRGMTVAERRPHRIPAGATRTGFAATVQAEQVRRMVLNALAGAAKA